MSPMIHNLRDRRKNAQSLTPFIPTFTTCMFFNEGWQLDLGRQSDQWNTLGATCFVPIFCLFFRSVWCRENFIVAYLSFADSRWVGTTAPSWNWAGNGHPGIHITERKRTWRARATTCRWFTETTSTKEARRLHFLRRSGPIRSEVQRRMERFCSTWRIVIPRYRCWGHNLAFVIVDVEGKQGSCLAEWVDVAGGWASPWYTIWDGLDWRKSVKIDCASLASDRSRRPGSEHECAWAH